MVVIDRDNTVGDWGGRSNSGVEDATLLGDPKRNRLVDVHLFDLGMCCGGRMEVF